MREVFKDNVELKACLKKTGKILLCMRRQQYIETVPRVLGKCWEQMYWSMHKKGKKYKTKSN